MLKAKIAVLVSGGGTNLQALIDAQKSGKLHSGEIALVVSNNQNAYALQRAKQNNIKTETLIIWGENDESTPIKDAYKMNKLIKSSGLVVIKGASHFCYLEYPGYIKVILDEYLKRGN